MSVLNAFKKIVEKNGQRTKDLSWVLDKIKTHHLSSNAINYIMSPAVLRYPHTNEQVRKMLAEMQTVGYELPLAGEDLTVWTEAAVMLKDGNQTARQTMDALKTSKDVRAFCGSTEIGMPPMVTYNPSFTKGVQYVLGQVMTDGSLSIVSKKEEKNENKSSAKAQLVAVEKTIIPQVNVSIVQPPTMIIHADIPVNKVTDPVTRLDILQGDTKMSVTHVLNLERIKRPYDTYLAAQLSFLVDFDKTRWVARDLSSCKIDAIKSPGVVAQFLNDRLIVPDVTQGNWGPIEAILAFLRGVPAKEYYELCQLLVEQTFNLDKVTSRDDNKFTKPTGSSIAVRRVVQKEKANIKDASLNEFVFAYSQMNSVPMTELAKTKGYVPGQSRDSMIANTLLFIARYVTITGKKVKFFDPKMYDIVDDYNASHEKDKIDVDETSGVFITCLEVKNTEQAERKKRLIDKAYNGMGTIVVGNIPPHWLRSYTTVTLPGPLRPDLFFIYDLESQWSFPLLNMANIPLKAYSHGSLIEIYNRARSTAVLNSLYPVSNIGLFSVLATVKRKRKAGALFEAIDLVEAVLDTEDGEVLDVRVHSNVLRIDDYHKPYTQQQSVLTTTTQPASVPSFPFPVPSEPPLGFHLNKDGAVVDEPPNADGEDVWDELDGGSSM